MNFGAGLDRQVAAAIRERGTRAILRSVTLTTGPAPMPSPPLLDDAVVGSPIAAGDMVLSINASVARGIIKAGDLLVIGSVSYPVMADVQSRPASARPGSIPGFDGVAVSTPLVATPAGTPVVLNPASDVTCYVIINNFPLQMIANSLIQAADVDVTMAAYGIREPSLLDRLIVNGRERAIMTVTPVYSQEHIIQYRLQAR